MEQRLISGIILALTASVMMTSCGTKNIPQTETPSIQMPSEEDSAVSPDREGRPTPKVPSLKAEIEGPEGEEKQPIPEVQKPSAKPVKPEAEPEKPANPEPEIQKPVQPEQDWSSAIQITEENGIKNVTFSHVPANIEEFSAMMQDDFTKPEKNCAMFLCALQMYIKDQDTGTEAINILRGPQPMTEYDIQFFHDRLRDKPYLPFAYFEGAKPENSYTPSEPFVLKVLPDPHPQGMKEGFIRVQLKTSGADSPRTMEFSQTEDNWYLWKYSGILSGITIPSEKGPPSQG